MESTTGQAWERLFKELDIRERLDTEGRFNLTASQIKKITGREPRTMSKWDSRGARPKILNQVGVTILPTSRQGYVLIKGDGYENLPVAGPAILHPAQRLQQITTLPWRKELTTESAAIDVAAISFMLQEFTQEDEITLTIRGRSGTPRFGFDFLDIEKRKHHIVVDRAQIEIDAGFEGENVWLVEAKIGEPEDFLVRQLYYPWRSWMEMTSKPVVPVFLNYSNKTFGFFRYNFKTSENYQSIESVENKWFTLDEPEAIQSFAELFSAARSKKPRQGIPFPQADTLGTVIAATELYVQDAATPKDVSISMGFDERQGSYYSTAAEWLDFIVRESGSRLLTPLGRLFVDASRWERFEILFRAIAATPIFRQAIAARLEGRDLLETEIAELILKARYSNDVTAKRRAKTVTAWIDWLWLEEANLRKTMGA